jgi:hypothetical protein
MRQKNRKRQIFWNGEVSICGTVPLKLKISPRQAKQPHVRHTDN